MFERVRDIAYRVWSYNGRMTFSELADELGFYGRSAPRRAGQAVQNAWNYYSRHGDTEACSAISRAFWPQANR